MSVSLDKHRYQPSENVQWIHKAVGEKWTLRRSVAAELPIIQKIYRIAKRTGAADAFESVDWWATELVAEESWSRGSVSKLIEVMEAHVGSETAD